MVIPNKVKKIWDNAFLYIRVNDLIVPYGVEEIGDSAFSSLYIKNDVSLPKSINKLGINVFGKQSLDNSDGFVYARNEDGTIDKSILMAYRAYLSDDILIIPEGVVEIRENVFGSSYNLDVVKLPSSLIKIGDSAFKSSGINEIILPTDLIEIGDNAFSQNYITELEIPSSVKFIGENAFYNNYGLSKVTLNEGISKIGSNAFSGSYSLRDTINIPSSVREIGENAFGNYLSKVYILGKKNIDDFDKLGNNPFGNALEIIYELS